MPNRSRPLRKIAIFSTQILISLLFTLALIEGGLRLFPQLTPLELLIHFENEPRTEIARRRNLPTKWGTVVVERDDGGPELRVFRPFAEVSWPGRETVVSVMDQIGFCNPPTSDYEAAQIELIAIGDSFTTCHGVLSEETWSWKLGELSGLSNYNLGRGGTGVQEHLQILKKFGLQKSPKLVIMNIYEGNDLRDAAFYYYHRQRAAAAQNTETPSAQIEQDQITFLERYSFSYNLAHAFLAYRSAPDSDPADLPDKPEAQNLFSLLPAHLLVDIGAINFRYRLVFPDTTITFNQEGTDLDEVIVARQLYLDAAEPGIMAGVAEALDTFVSLAEAHQFVPVVTYTPSAHTAYAAQVAYDDPALHELMPWFSQYQRAYFQAKGEALGYHFIDLTPGLQTAAQAQTAQNLLYSPIDLHLTPLGHVVVAQIIHQALRDLEVLTGHDFNHQNISGF